MRNQKYDRCIRQHTVETGIGLQGIQQKNPRAIIIGKRDASRQCSGCDHGVLRTDRPIGLLGQHTGFGRVMLRISTNRSVHTVIIRTKYDRPLNALDSGMYGDIVNQCIKPNLVFNVC